jgi:glycosyltransferase involved in cell wall biosynthesis
MDKVFVITVCRNASTLLEFTIQSVLDQTYNNLHYIIIDGGSTDGSLDIIQKYSHRLVAWVSEPDKGIYDAMNKGIKIAKQYVNSGERAWVNFMNVGDRFSDETVVSDVFHRSIANNRRVIVGHFNQCFKDRKVLKKVDDFSLIPLWMPFCHQATFVRLDNCSFDTRFKIAADYHLFYNIYFEKGTDAFLCVDRVVADFQMEGSTTFTHLRQTKKEILKIQSKHKSWFWFKECIKWILKK